MSLFDDAILLGAVAYGDADRVVTLMTRSHGKVGAMARGARKSSKRFGGGLAPFVVGEAALKERRGADLMLLESFHVKRDFTRLGLDVVKLGHASYGGELVRELSPPHRPDPGLFDLLVELFEVIEATPPRADTLRAFELKVLAELGLGPALDRCVGCDTDDAEVLDRALVAAGRGGLLCGPCAGAAGAGVGIVRALPPAARARLLLLEKGSLADAAARPPARETETSAREVLAALLGVHLAREPRSVEFMRKLREFRS